MKRHFRLSSSIAAALLAFACFAPGASAADADATPASWRPAPLRLVGVWDVQVTLRDCVSGHAVASFPAMNQYSADGSELEFGVNTSPAARYPSLGTWHFAGLRKYHSEFSFFRFAPDGSYAGTQHVERTLTLSHEADRFTSVAHVTIYDTQQHVLGTGCATEEARRR